MKCSCNSIGSVVHINRKDSPRISNIIDDITQNVDSQDKILALIYSLSDFGICPYPEEVGHMSPYIEKKDNDYRLVIAENRYVSQMGIKKASKACLSYVNEENYTINIDEDVFIENYNEYLESLMEYSDEEDIEEDDCEIELADESTIDDYDDLFESFLESIYNGQKEAPIEVPSYIYKVSGSEIVDYIEDADAIYEYCDNLYLKSHYCLDDFLRPGDKDAVNGKKLRF